MILTPRSTEIRHFHLFCGLGGGARGFNRGHARVGHAEASFRCVGGVDVDKSAIADFSRLAGVRGTVLDLFSREQYVAFHGQQPPAEWREATPDDIRAAANYEQPHILFGSAPCKGFSGLLSESRSGSDKYQALNQLALRGLWLALEAWKNDPLEFILWENVPRIATRGRVVLDGMIRLLEAYGYAVAETTHDCGELGGLGQRRKRFLLVARHREKVPPFLYEPPKRPLRSVGDIIGRLPMPGPTMVLPMHRLPALQWQTWVRLAFVEAGSDWRSLNKLRVDAGVLQDYGLVPGVSWHNGALGVERWDDVAGTVTGNGRPASGTFAVADPRSGYTGEYQQIGVRRWEEPCGVVSGQMQVGGGPHAVADPRVLQTQYGRGRVGVLGWEQTSGVIRGESLPSNGPFAVADPRPELDASRGGLGVLRMDDTAGTIIGVRAPGQGTFSVADPRMLGAPRFNHVYRIVPWGAQAPAIAGGGGPAGGLAVADPRTGYPEISHRHKFAVTEWDQAGGAVTGANHVTGGAMCVADPRPASGWNGKGKYVVAPFDGQANTVIAGSTTGNGAYAVADPRPLATRDGKDIYKTTGEYGVVPWDDTSGAVTAAAGHDNGRWSVADPRQHGATENTEETLPAPTERLVACIRAIDGTYHRPFTTLELAALQSLVDPDEILELEGASDSAHRERIGNAVPPDAAEAIASVMGQTLLLAWAGETFQLSAMPVWVQPLVIAIAVKSDTSNFFQ